MDFQDFRQVGVFGFEKEPNFECVASTDREERPLQLLGRAGGSG